MEKRKLNRVVIIVLAIIVFLIMFPVIVTCGTPGYTCTPAPDKDGMITRPNDIEPLIVYILESATHEDSSFKYFEFYSKSSL